MTQEKSTAQDSATDLQNASDNNGDTPLSAEALAAIDYEVQKYPPKRAASAVMSALRIAQKEQGWLSPNVMAFIAAYLSMPEIRVYEVATFYNMYDLSPVGRHKLCLCTNLPCALMGAMKTKTAIEETLGMRFGETNEEWTLKEGECFGACGDGPVIIENNEKMHSKIDADKVPNFLASLKGDSNNAAAPTNTQNETSDNNGTA